MATLYRAECRREHGRRVSVWRGKWRKDKAQAIEQARRWQRRELFAVVSVVSSDGMKATLAEMEQERRKPR